MATVYQLRTFADLVAGVREELGIQSSDAVAVSRIKRDLNIVYDEVKSETAWHWLTGHTTVQLPAYHSAGTVSVTQGSSVATLSVAPGTRSFEGGYKFAVDGYQEVYEVERHDAGSLTVYLKDEYTGSTNATCSYVIWTDKVQLPVDCQEISQVTHGYSPRPLDIIGIQEMRRIMGPVPRMDGVPQWVSLGELADPSATAAITSLPALSTRSSSGMTKSLVFASAIPAAIVSRVDAGEPVRWRVSRAGSPSYNGDITISSIATTSVANDTLTYTGRSPLDEDATADAALTVRALVQTLDYDKYRELLVYPAINSGKLSMQVDYTRDAAPLVEDDDEPLIPFKDRIVLLYGALARGWVKQRNTETFVTNESKYKEKLGKMQGKAQETADKPRLSISRGYLAAKRAGGSSSSAFSSQAGAAAGGSAPVVSGTPGAVAVYDTRGAINSSSVTSTELASLDGITGSVEDRLDNLEANLDTSSTATLTDNAATEALSYAHATTPYAEVFYGLTRGATRESGKLVLVTDGVDVEFSQGPVPAIGSPGVTFSAAVVGANVVLTATLTSTGSDAAFSARLSSLA